MKLQTKGQHRIQFQAAELPSGLYFYTLQAGENRITKQMAITR